MGDQQGKGCPRPDYLLDRNAQEVGDGQLFVEDDQDGGLLAVVVEGPVGGNCSGALCVRRCRWSWWIWRYRRWMVEGERQRGADTDLRRQAIGGTA